MLHDNTRYIMRDQVRDQVSSIMGGAGKREEGRDLAGHLYVTGAVAFFYALLIALAQ